MKKIQSILDKIYGCGVFICLFGGGATFLGFLIAFIVGGDTATVICEFIYKKLFSWLIYGGNVVVALALINMYLKRQKALTINDSAEMETD